MRNTNISAPDYFHKVVDCQWACPAHTPVPEYIRMIAHGRYSDAYMLNWKSNVFPGILGRTCDRPCEPACRRVRVENEPVAICRLKRVAADYKDDIDGAAAQAGAAQERQAHRAGRRRSCLADGGARSGAVRLHLRGVRRRPAGRRHDPLADPEIPSARQRDRRGMRLHPRSRRRIPRRHPHRQSEGAAGRRLGRDLRRLRRAARPRPRHSRPRRKRPRTSISASTGSIRFRSATPPRSASAWSCSAAAIPPWTAAARPAASAARTCRWWCVRASRK